MAIASTNLPATKLAVAKIPYLNCAPFFSGLALPDAWEWVELPPRQLGLEAQQGRVVAGPMSLADYLRQRDQFERLGPLGIAVRGRCGSVMCFSRKPIRQIDETVTVSVTDHTSTSILFFRLVLEQRYQRIPHAYVVGGSDDADVRLLIGDEALKFRATNRSYPFEIDVAWEWWLWQHLPAVFAVWVIRKDAPVDEKQRLSRALQQQLARNMGQLETIAAAHSSRLGIPAAELKSYLENFVYRLSEPEERAITQFEALVDEHHLR